MRFITAIGRKWGRAAGAALTIVLLSAVAVLGVIQLGSKVSAAWKAPGSAEQTLASGGTFKALLNFAAPAETVAKYKDQAKKAENSIKRASDRATYVKNWMYTQGPFEPVSVFPDLGLSGLSNIVFVFFNPPADLKEEIRERQFELADPNNSVSTARAVYLFGLAVVAIDGFVDSSPFLTGSPLLLFLDRLLATYYRAAQQWLLAYNGIPKLFDLPSLVAPPLPPLPSPASPFF